MRHGLNIFITLLLGFSALAANRPTGYGAVPGYCPIAFGNGVELAHSLVWCSHKVDVIGFY